MNPMNARRSRRLARNGFAVDARAEPPKESDESPRATDRPLQRCSRSITAKFTVKQQQHENLYGRNVVREETEGETPSDRPIRHRPNTPRAALEKTSHPGSGRP